ncbi:MAG: NAD-dependent epimerase/dehydratase family protein [Bacteroidota bacterium]
MSHDLSIAGKINELEGPIFVFGAGGFIGINLFNAIFRHRKDVYAITQDPRNNWRFIVNDIPAANILSCDINDLVILKDTLNEHKPKTIFNLAAYGAYSKQKEYKKIYGTNFNSEIDILEILKSTGFSAYVHAGSSSEYGTNSAAPREEDELVPNSHYAVSKVAAFYAVKYYGKIEQLPVAHLRLYSAFGPWEEPDRLMPVLIAAARKQIYPPLVHPDISRDFIDVADVCDAFVLTAHEIEKVKGEAFNIGTDKKTTIRQLTAIIKDEFGIPELPEFGSMPNRNWDVADWYANSQKAKQLLGWEARISLLDGIRQVASWQKEVNFDTAFWNWNKHA